MTRVKLLWDYSTNREGHDAVMQINKAVERGKNVCSAFRLSACSTEPAATDAELSDER